MEDLFNYFTTDNISGKKCTEKWLSKNNNQLYDSIIEWCDNIKILKNIEFKRKVYHFVNNLYNIPVCLKCNKNVKYKRLRDGYQPYCSVICQKSCEIASQKWKKSWHENNDNGQSIKKRRKTVLEKYGSIDDYKNHIQDKKKKSCLKKYGVEFITQTESYKLKRKESLLEKYGSETYNNPSKTKETRICNGTQIDDSNIDDFLSYKKISVNRTMTIYRNNKDMINPNKLKRGIKHFHIDHKFSLKQAFLLNLPIEVITHPCNLEMVFCSDNISKQDNCTISLNDLINNIIGFDKEIVFTNKEIFEKYKSINNNNLLSLL